ncbi:non-ribosomal peptide synthetase [Leptolyngbya boryana]|nr:amino acid adenylation domain-containing protein [Leptolyngbya sp. FACHB-161]MBD2377285.1 amino acid adenylation domain-containing protein [Leptolyngbya sp. FACHB-238]MBD2401747.1 amino acid adenylation domain-containing protein [Leptolyngbya sp. FACHB-239]MBD2408214.1 amino acid adenylation domain-containing protein [Leptolyngbya sp. FACHB-402]ULP33928.1 non-ribosomal peptide synthetase [Leptolyngbya boryana IU 594]
MNHPSDAFPETFWCESTLVALLRYRAMHQPDRLAFTFLLDGETEAVSFTYKELDRQSRAIAARLQAMGLGGERALLLYPPGLDYLAAFFGCLYAGVVAVPAYPPHNQRNTPRIAAILSDAQAAIALTTTAILDRMQSLLAEKMNGDTIQWLTTDNLEYSIAETWQEPLIENNTLAFLQYTSGSTGTPKGVMLSHSNLLHNAAATYRYMEHSPSSTFVSWLPAYHDMGLIGGILQPLYGGFPCILMSPASFLQRPYRWLQAISRYQGTTSGAPNFAYDLCVEKITAEQRQTLDLSHWSVAFNGAEPIRHSSLERFAATFAECGFRREAFYPCYGMAEATLMVSGGVQATAPVIKTVQKAALERSQVVEADAGDAEVWTLIGCGKTIPEQHIVIVHPETLDRCQPGEVGEIWVSGSSVGQGYWNRPEESAQTFQAYLSDTHAGPFLRTGDLGFLHDGELFITGRAKDLIIIRGRNLYPQDLEFTAERSHPTLRIGSSAAFAIALYDAERLVVVQEVEFRQKPNVQEVTQAIRQAIAEAHEVQAYAVVLIKAGTIPKTSSGKIQRRACKAAFLAGNLAEIGSSILEMVEVENLETSLTRADLFAFDSAERETQLTDYVRQQVARVLRIAATQVDVQHPLSRFGLDSLMIFEIKSRIELDFGVEIAIADLFEGASIAELVAQILNQLTTSNPQSACPIVRVKSATNCYSLSFAQQRLWFLDQLEAANSAYHIAIAVQLQGELNITVLEKSLTEIIRRHEILRTTFCTIAGQVMQQVTDAQILPLTVVDLRSWVKSEQEVEAQRITKQAIQQPFDLQQEPLFRATLMQLGQEDHQLLLTMHHIISDRWSAEVMLQELATLYDSYSQEWVSPLPELPIQYADFAHWQRTWLQGEVLETQLAYWKQQLNSAPTVLHLPSDRPRPAAQTFRGATKSLHLSRSLTNSLKALARQEGVTLFMLLLAVFKTLMYRYSGQDRISVGSPIANRNRNEITGLIGFFVNTLVLHTDLAGNPSFRELLNRVRQVALGAYTHQDLPFEQLVEAVQPERNMSYSPLFQVMFTLQNAPQLPEIPDLALKPIKVTSETAQFDLSVAVETVENGLVADFEYNTDLFDESTIARMQHHFQTLLESIVTNPNARLSDLPLLTAQEQQQLWQWGNQAVSLNPNPDLCIHQLFEAQAKRTPDAIAVIFEQQQLTYQDLNNQADHLANFLRSLGVAPEGLVGICATRSLDLIIGLLAILKAGGAYVPLDPNLPKERLALMLEDTQVPVLLTQTSLLNILPETTARVVCLDSAWNLSEQQSAEHCAPVASNLAYVIYTSGSTGKPKGVMIEHRSLVSYIETASVEYGIKPGDRVLQFASLSFDVAAEEIFVSLTQGATLVLRTDAMLDSVSTFLQQCRELALTVLDLPTAFWHQITVELAQGLELPESLRLVIIGGEPALSERLLAWQMKVRDRVQLLNAYGPTETTIGATICDLSTVSPANSGRIAPIGYPLHNTQLYVLDQNQQPVAIGVPGELYVGGGGIARGYLNQPELTAERFIPNPFDRNSTLLYKTGDRVRYLPNGMLEFLDRIDDQVKIRGFRIELGEIEATLRQHPDVQEAIVLAWADHSNNKRLTAYIRAATPPTPIDLRHFLEEKLPQYMIPATFLFLDALPLTPSGKIDRRALPAPETAQIASTSTYVAPKTEVEQAISEVWQAVLQIEKVGIYDNFFDLGGHSLLVLQVQSKLQIALKRSISVTDLFQYPNISALANYLNQTSSSKVSLQAVRDRAAQQRAAFNRQKQLRQSGK